MFQKSKVDLAKEKVVQLYGTKNCKKLVNMPSSEKAFSELKRAIEREYSKYKDDLSDEQYQQFVEEIYEIFKEFKINLENEEEKYYGDIYGCYTVKVADVKLKYGI